MKKPFKHVAKPANIDDVCKAWGITKERLKEIRKLLAVCNKLPQP